jgi:hypothetical protein
MSEFNKLQETILLAVCRYPMFLKMLLIRGRIKVRIYPVSRYLGLKIQGQKIRCPIIYYPELELTHAACER